MSTTPAKPKSRRLTVRDLRTNRPDGAQEEYRINLTASEDHLDLYQYFIQRFGSNDFVISLPNRSVVNEDNYKTIISGQTLIITDTVDQKLDQVVKHSVNIAPHPDTITKSGMYEYYDSRGIDSVVISIAELIDNSLAATKNNKGLRFIEIRYYDNGFDSMVAIIDNGKGMGFDDLNNWAKFKCSKFVRTTGDDCAVNGFDGFSSDNLPLGRRPALDTSNYRIRYMDSDINYFGAGGKQAIFNIGETTTMITKRANCTDIFELNLSKNRFDHKSRSNPDDVYKEDLFQRTKGTKRVGNGRKVSDEIENAIIEDIETTYESFTICCIKDVFPRHHSQFKMNTENAKYWTKGLARIYHYYIHGPNGNTGVVDKDLIEELKNINIYIKIFGVNRHQNEIQTPLKHETKLNDINDDFETQLVRSAKDVFEFEVDHMDKGSTIEGIVRYHPYLYEKETLPVLSLDEDLGETASQMSAKTDGNFDEVECYPKRHRYREIFECFWHGRLIPQDCIDFDWNKYNPKNSNIPKDLEECFSRLSGALFTNSEYQVSQNKQSFMDLSKLMAQKDRLTFFRITGNKTRKRCNFDTEFLNWLKSCHQKYDKQVSYKDYQHDILRSDYPLLKKSYCLTNSFSVFNEIEWRNQTFKKGYKILTQGTKPAKLIGCIEKFLVPMKCSGDYIGSPGFIEISLIPSEIYGKETEAAKVITFSQLNIDATAETIQEELTKSLDKLPAEIVLSFPEKYGIENGDELMAGRPIGAIQARLKNLNEEYLKSDRIPYKMTYKKLSIQLEIHKVDGEDTVMEVEYPIASYDKNWDFWFLKHEGITKPGKYRIVCVCLSTSANSTQATGDFANGERLPKADDIEFTVVAGPPKTFKIMTEIVNTSIGKAFDVSLELSDEFGNIVVPNPTIHKPVLSIEGFHAKYSTIQRKGEKLIVKDVVISGRIGENRNPVLEISLQLLGVTKEVIIHLHTPSSTHRPPKRTYNTTPSKTPTPSRTASTSSERSTPRTPIRRDGPIAHSTPNNTSGRDYIRDPPSTSDERPQRIYTRTPNPTETVRIGERIETNEDTNDEQIDPNVNHYHFEPNIEANAELISDDSMDSCDEIIDRLDEPIDRHDEVIDEVIVVPPDFDVTPEVKECLDLMKAIQNDFRQKLRESNLPLDCSQRFEVLENEKMRKIEILKKRIEEKNNIFKQLLNEYSMSQNSSQSEAPNGSQSSPKRRRNDSQTNGH